MASIETVTELAGVARYILASQNILRGTAANKFTPLDNFEGCKDITSQQSVDDASLALGRQYVEHYRTDRSGEKNGLLTLSLTDTSRISSLNDACKDFVDAFVQMDDNYIVQFLKDLHEKGTNYPKQKWMKDLGNMALTSKNTAGASLDLMVACDSILDALDDAIIINNQEYRPRHDGFDKDKSSGLTITLPTTKNQYYPRAIPLDTKMSSLAPAFEEKTGWSGLLQRIRPLLKEQGELESSLQEWIISGFDDRESIGSLGQDLNLSYSRLDEDTLLFIDHTKADNLELYLDSNDDQKFDSNVDRLIGFSKVEKQFRASNIWETFDFNPWKSVDIHGDEYQWGKVDFLESYQEFPCGSTEVHSLQFSNPQGDVVATVDLIDHLLLGDQCY